MNLAAGRVSVGSLNIVWTRPVEHKKRTQNKKFKRPNNFQLSLIHFTQFILREFVKLINFNWIHECCESLEQRFISFLFSFEAFPTTTDRNHNSVPNSNDFNPDLLHFNFVRVIFPEWLVTIWVDDIPKSGSDHDNLSALSMLTHAQCTSDIKLLIFEHHAVWM